MSTEWEELEKCSKDELIIELVKTRWEKRNLQAVILDLSRNMGSYSVFVEGEKPPSEWQRKIAEYVFRDGDYHSLREWGVDEDTADELYDRYHGGDGDKKTIYMDNH